VGTSDGIFLAKSDQCFDGELSRLEKRVLFLLFRRDRLAAVELHSLWRRYQQSRACARGGDFTGSILSDGGGAGCGTLAESRRQFQRGSQGGATPVVALSGALGFALLLLCINVSYLRRVHLEARGKEIALRVALGAGRLILIRQLLMDTLQLFGIGTGIGIWLSPFGVHLLLASIPARQIPWLHMQIDGTVLLFSAGVTLPAAVLTGLIPVLGASRSALAANLGSGGAVTGTASVGWRLRGSIIVTQIALALVPLCGAVCWKCRRVLLRARAYGAKRPLCRTIGDHVAGKMNSRREPAGSQCLEVGLAQAIPISPGARWLQARTDPKGIHNLAQLPLVRYTVVTSGYLKRWASS
jgi:hypothetical protein